MNYNLETWMSVGELHEKIKNTDLRYIKIPATHNSGAYRTLFPIVRALVNCQGYYIRDQLKRGVRSFDIRIMCSGFPADGPKWPLKVEFFMHHEGIVDCAGGNQELSGAIGDFGDFAKAHPGEFFHIRLSAGYASNLNGYPDKFKEIDKLIQENLSDRIIKTTDLDFAETVTLETIKKLKRNVLITIDPDFKKILEKAVDKKDYWVDNLFSGTWDKSQSSSQKPLNEKVNLVKAKIKQRLNERKEYGDKLFFSCDCAIWDYDIERATNGEVHPMLKDFFKNEDINILKKVNLVTIDFANDDIARSIIDLNTK